MALLDGALHVWPWLRCPKASGEADALTAPARD
jgi:hypothetical protein